MKKFSTYKKGFLRIEPVIIQAAKNYHLEGAFYKAKVLKHWQEVASGFVSQATDLTKAIEFKKGVLTVACLSREVAYNIKLLAVRIIESLNQLLGKTVVFAIQVEL